MTFINRAEVVADQVVDVGVGTPIDASWGVLTNVAYQPVTNAMATSPASPGVDDPSAGAMRFTNDNRLYTWPVETLGAPVGVTWNSGLPFEVSGRMVVSTGVVAGYVSGWPVTVDGWVCAT